MVYVDDGIIIGSSDSQRNNVIKDLQDLSLKIEVKVILPTMLESISASSRMDPMNSHRKPSLIQSSRTLGLLI